MLSALISLPATASENCDDVIQAADAAIAARDRAIDLQSHRIDDLTDENKRLSNAIVELNQMNRDSTNREVIYGVVGIVVGAVAMSFVKK